MEPAIADPRDDITSEKNIRRRNLYVPKLLADMMWAVTRNSTTLHYGTHHRCLRHNRYFDLAHLKECDLLHNCEGIDGIANHIKNENIRTWKEVELAEAITKFASIHLQLNKLIYECHVQFVKDTIPPSTSNLMARDGLQKQRGRPKKPLTVVNN